MFDRAITIYNLLDGVWHPTVVSGVSVYTVQASDLTVNGVNNIGQVQVIIPSNKWKHIGGKIYVGPKEYAAKNDPESFVTFAPEQDFIMDGAYADVEDDEDYTMGFYHEMNNTRDGVYMVKAAEYLPLIPHFEVSAQ